MRRPSGEEWKRLIAEYETSGLSHKDFTAKHELPLSTFQFWLYGTRKKQRTRTSESDSDTGPRFLPLEVVASPALARDGGDVVELALRSGTTVRFPVGTDTNYVAALLAALG